MSDGRVFIVGGGLAGLSAAVALAAKDVSVTLIEGTGQAGGRCRSYFDATLGQVIDNGNHLLLSGNHATHDYLRTIGAADKLAGPERARFAFANVRSGERWTIAPNDGPLAWWVLARNRRVPGSSLSEYLSLLKLLAPAKGKRINEVIACRGPLWEKLLHPFLLAALNTEPQSASADLAAAVIRETLAKGGKAYRPRIATPHLGAAFIEPALAYLKTKGAEVQFGRRLRAIAFDDKRAATLEFTDGPLALAAMDRVILATPAWVTTELLPGTPAPTEFRAIVNAHFVAVPPKDAAAMAGVIGGTAEWVFAFHDRLSVTVSGADRLVDTDRESLAKLLWRDVAAVHGLAPELPPWQIVKERRATFAATPAQNARRPGARTNWTNLILAGDWTDTGLPATIEGAVRSGQRAAQLARAATSV
ncbi:MAG: hydroxysqualene dehydroxylase HpnE [Alphaproteobacteria bacterium]|nr:hydroxysqualene dehydroxylase HpnE [Alphaproteobacteria bacterium]